MSFIVIRHNNFTQSIKLQFHLLVNKQDVPHFCFKQGGSFFTVISDIKKLYFRCFQDLPHPGLCNGFLMRKPCLRGMPLYILVEILKHPQFLGVAQICRTLAGSMDNPSLSAIRNFHRMAAAFCIGQGGFYAAFTIFPHTEPYHINADVKTQCGISIHMAFFFFQEYAGTVNHVC